MKSLLAVMKSGRDRGRFSCGAGPVDGDSGKVMDLLNSSPWKTGDQAMCIWRRFHFPINAERGTDLQGQWGLEGRGEGTKEMWGHHLENSQLIVHCLCVLREYKRRSLMLENRSLSLTGAILSPLIKLCLMSDIWALLFLLILSTS